jgi:ubiquinone biosynthesis monooxygenase Coq7
LAIPDSAYRKAFGGAYFDYDWDMGFSSDRRLYPDRLVSELDKVVRVLFGEAVAGRPGPALGATEDNLDSARRRHAAALMRVNHCGEVCAQALYQGQALASSDTTIKDALEKAAKEEGDHLAWSAERVRELGGRLSLLNPLWYAGSFALGYAAGRFGDDWNLGFLAETERQVEQHLEGHLQRLGGYDTRTRAVIEGMRREEAEHRRTAERLGARKLPGAARQAMRLAARLMTTLSYRI